MTSLCRGSASHLYLADLFTPSMNARQRWQALALGACILLLFGSISALTHAQSLAFVGVKTMVPPGGSEAGVATRRGLSSLPAAAQGPISAVLGQGDSRYWFYATEASIHAENPQHALNVDLTPHGAKVHSDAAWWGLALRGYGYGHELLAINHATPQVRMNRVEFRRGALREWYINGPLGLEQGFTFIQPPGKANFRPLTVALTLSGDLMATLEASGTALTLTRRDGQAVLRFGGLVAFDARGHALRGWIRLRGKELLLQVDDAGAEYPVVVDPLVEQAELAASDGAAGDLFGDSVALSSDGKTALVGAYGKSFGDIHIQGAAYVFTSASGIWSQQQELTASDGAAGDYFGCSVALSSDGNTALVGAYNKTVGQNSQQGVAYVFANSSGSWSQQRELAASDGAAADLFGNSVAMSSDGNTALVGAVGKNSLQGAAYVFTSASGIWSQQQELNASDGATGQFGISVALSSDGSTALVGAVAQNSLQGAAYVFTNASGIWNQQQELTASDGAATDFFGISVALSSDGNTALVGADDKTVGQNSAQGAAYVFTSASGIWSQQQELTASDGAAGDSFGYPVALSSGGTTALVGAYHKTVGQNSQQGAAYVFASVSPRWSQQQELTESDGAAGDWFGVAAALSNDGSTALVGAFGKSLGQNLVQGVAYVYVNNLGVAVAAPQLLGQSGSTTNPTASFAEPVNTATGNYFSSATDLAVSGTGLSFIFNRYYNSLDSYSGPLGPGWSHTYNVFLRQDPTSGTVTIKQPDGSSVTFSRSASGTYTAATIGLFDHLQQNTDGSFTLVRHNQVTLHFAANGRLGSVADTNGNTQTLTYSAAGDLASITDTTGRVFTLNYNANHKLLSVSDPTKRTVLYMYDAKGNLASCTNAAGGVTTYVYDAASRVISAMNPVGVTYVQNMFDANGRVTLQTNGRGASTHFAYNTPTTGTTTITDGNGNTLLHVYDAAYRLITSIDGAGSTSTFSYDANNDTTSVTDGNGNMTSFTYDQNGNLLTTTNAAGNQAVFTYDARNSLTSMADFLGHTTALSYDAAENLLTIRDALNGVTRFTHDLKGNILSISDAIGNTSHFSWDGFGDLIGLVDGAERRRTFVYDSVSRLTSSIDGLGHPTTFQYDPLNRIINITDPLGDHKQFTYNAIGHVVNIKDANGNATTYQYDGNGNLTQMADALGQLTTYHYDANNNRVSLTNARGKTTSYAYDAANRRIRITDALGRTTSFSYDLAGNVLAETDGNAKINHFAYDLLNRLTTIAYSDGNNVSYSYDINGNQTAMTDSLGSTAYKYDVLNRLVFLSRFDGKTVGYTYNGVGERASLTYPDGRVVKYSFDGSQKLSSVTDWNGRSSIYSYDQAGNLVSIQLPNTVLSTFAYDPANRLVSVTNASRGGTISAFAYGLDKVGNRISVQSGWNGSARYEYDAVYRLIGWTSNNNNHAASYTYDSVGNRTSQTFDSFPFSYSYDDADELLSAGPVSFTYDGDGNRLTATALTFTASYAWNAANQLTSVSGPLGTVHYTYDGHGGRVSQSTEFAKHAYVNDVLRRVSVVINDEQQFGSTDYIHGYSLIGASTGARKNYVDVDGLGSTVDVTNRAGAIEESFSYDPWGASVNSFGGGGESVPYRFTGQALDAEGLYYMHARYYDPLVGRFLSRDPIGTRFANPFEQNRYIYARNNPLLYVDPTGLSSESLGLGDATTEGSFGTGKYGQHVLGQAQSPFGSYGPAAAAGILIGAAAIVYSNPAVEAYCALQPFVCAGAVGKAVGWALGEKTGLPSNIGFSGFGQSQFGFGDDVQSGLGGLGGDESGLGGYGQIYQDPFDVGNSIDDTPDYGVSNPWADDSDIIIDF